MRLEDALSRMDRYSTASATALVASGRRVSFFTGIGHGLFAFLRTYVLRAGFLSTVREKAPIDHQRRRQLLPLYESLARHPATALSAGICGRVRSRKGGANAIG